MMTKLSQLTNRLDAICELELEIPCLLTGFYLEDADIEGLTPYMSNEDLREYSVGSYRNVQIYRKCLLAELDYGEVGDHDGLTYTFFRLNVVN